MNEAAYLSEKSSNSFCRRNQSQCDGSFASACRLIKKLPNRMIFVVLFCRLAGAKEERERVRSDRGYGSNGE